MAIQTSFQLSPLWHHMINLALSVGSDSNGSGVVALLEISRLFSILYSNPNTRGRYNILFGLTSGGPYNYNGTQKWLTSFDQRLREFIDYAICLNSLRSGENGLWLHVSKPPENPYVKQIFEGLSNVAEELRVTVGLKHKKINVSNSRLANTPMEYSPLYDATTWHGFSSILLLLYLVQRYRVVACHGAFGFHLICSCQTILSMTRIM